MPQATALCCLEDMELKMINQNAARFYDEIAYRGGREEFFFF